MFISIFSVQQLCELGTASRIDRVQTEQGTTLLLGRCAPEPKCPFIIAPKILLIAAVDGSGTANIANWRLSRFGMSFLPPPASQSMLRVQFVSEDGVELILLQRSTSRTCKTPLLQTIQLSTNDGKGLPITPGQFVLGEFASPDFRPCICTSSAQALPRCYDTVGTLLRICTWRVHGGNTARVND